MYNVKATGKVGPQGKERISLCMQLRISKSPFYGSYAFVTPDPDSK